MHLKGSFESVNLNNEVIAVPVGDVTNCRNVIKLNETAAYIFNLLQNEISENEIVDSVVNEYLVERDIVASDVHRCIDVWRDRGLLVE